MQKSGRLKTMICSSVALAITAAFFFSCASVDKNAKLAQQQCNKYFEYMKANNVDSTLQLFAVKPMDPAKSTLIKDIKEHQQDVGRFISAELYNTDRKTIMKDGIKQDNITITYKATYDSSYQSKEQFYFHIDNNFTGKIDSVASEGWEEKKG